jgi:hypothetical protein
VVDPVGEFVGVEGGVMSPLRTTVAFDSPARDSDELPELGGGIMGNKTPVSLFEHTGHLDYCFGLIGESNRICVKIQGTCDIGIHKTRFGRLEVGFLYRGCPTRLDCVYMTPSVDVMAEIVPDCVSEFLMQEQRSVEEHIQLFSSLPTEDEVLGGAVAERFKLFGQQSETGVQFGRTPARERVRMTCLLEDPGFGETPEGTAGVLGLSKKIQDIVSRLEQAQSESTEPSPFENLVMSTVSELASLAKAQGEAIWEMEAGSNATTTRLEGSVVSLKADIGSRPRDTSTLPGLQMWEIVNGLAKGMSELRGELEGVERRLGTEEEANRHGAMELESVKQELAVAQDKIVELKTTGVERGNQVDTRLQKCEAWEAHCCRGKQRFYCQGSGSFAE